MEIRKRRKVKILKQEKNDNQVTLDIEESYSSLAPHMEKAFKEVSNEIKVPGFRQGKIPTDVIKKYINEEAVMDRALQSLISEIYPRIITESNIRPVDYPNVEVKQLKQGQPILISIKVDVYPEIKLGNYKGLQVKRKSAAVESKEVDGTIDFIKKNYADQNKISEADVLLDDDFARKVSRMNTYAELRELIKNNIEEEKKHDAEASVKDDVTKKLADIVDVQVPKGMIDREIEQMLSDLEISLKRNRMTLKSYLSAMKKDVEKLKEEMKASAELRVKAKLALEEIAKKEKIAIDDVELDKELQALAQHAGKTLEGYKADLSPDVLDTIKEFMIRDKAIELVVSKAKIEEAA